MRKTAPKAPRGGTIANLQEEVARSLKTMRPGCRLALAAVTLLTLLAAAPLMLPPAAATHESTHRYYVYGRITDTTGAPVSGLLVEVEVPGATTYSEQHLWTGVTETSGRYSILVHLHHLGAPTEDSGLTLHVRVPSVGASANFIVTASAVPADQSQDPETVGWGYTRADFAVTPPAPPPPFDIGVYRDALFVVGGMAAALILLALLWRRGEGRRQEARVVAQRQEVGELPGVGRATANKLAAAGYPTIPQLARADAAELAEKLGLNEAQAKRLIAKASQFGKRP